MKETREMKEVITHFPEVGDKVMDAGGRYGEIRAINVEIAWERGSVVDTEVNMDRLKRSGDGWYKRS